MVQQSIDSKWRNLKSKLKANYYDPEKSIQSQSTCPTERVVELGHSPTRDDEFNRSYSNSNTIDPNNILSQVLGSDKYGRVCILVLVICPKPVDLHLCWLFMRHVF
ncbi:hypothetical protein M9H77_22045 [Catharanthus roseus]|uniref:Uncharacterized protein n=1 Tax=Catharanthus roseus TaxID=4058 RepID=A0ACC0AQK2_CATRO|nr:hypothetical protein M9H77_22045 [Catharanthus roseus]